MVKLRRFFKGTYLGVMLLFLYAPIIVLIALSFNESKSASNWAGFSFKWYVELLQDRSILSALWVTLSVALLSAIISTFVGTLAAIGIYNFKKVTRSLVINTTYIPVLNPDLVTGISLMLIFVFLKMPRGYMTLLLSHITFNIPYVIFSVLPRLRQMPNQLYEAALDLGATPSMALRKVIIPQIMPGVLTGLILAFTLSLDDFVVSFFTQQAVPNLSVLIYSMARRGINPKINALSAIMFVTVLTLLLIVNLRSSRDAKKPNGKKLENR